MQSSEIEKRRLTLDDLSHIDEETGIEYWYARDLQTLLGYTKWQNFEEAIQRARTSLETTKTPDEEHFAGVSKMVKLGSGAERKIKDYKLTRYACYLIAQNGDPRKEEIAFAQSYFALQTRKQELIEERMEAISRISNREQLTEAEKKFSGLAYERGVDGPGIGRIRSKGDKALFGGHDTRSMKRRLGVGDKQPLADRLPAVTLAAKQLATEMTNHNMEEKDLYGESPITVEHVQNNEGVRDLLKQRGIEPENLPAGEDIKKLKRRVDREQKKLGQETKGFPRVEE